MKNSELRTRIRRDLLLAPRSSLFKQVLSQPMAGSTYSRQNSAERYAECIGRFLVGKFTDDDQQEGLAQFLGKLREGLLHFVCELVVGWVRCRDWHFQRSVSNEHHSSACTPPTIYNSSTQDRSQPRPLAATRCKVGPTPPRTAQCLLHDILRIMRVADQPIGDSIQCRSMIVDQNNKVCPRKCHPLPLSVSLFRRITGGRSRG